MKNRPVCIATATILLCCLALPNPSAAQQKVATYQDYDQWGNLLKVTEADGPTLNFFYGSNSQPMTQTTLNGVSGIYLTGILTEGSPPLEQQAEYNSLGQLTKLNDPSGTIQRFAYDELGRLDTVRNDANELVSAYEYKLNFTGGTYSGSNANWVQTRQHTASQTRYATEYVDGLGRSIQTQQRVGADDIVAKTTTYDAAGRPHKTYKGYKDNTGHGYDDSFDSHASTFYSGITGGGTPYQETEYELSPSGR